MQHAANHHRERELVDIRELARRLNLPRAFLDREARAGRIPSLRAGARWRFNPSAVERALAERAAGTDPEAGAEGGGRDG